MDQSCFRGERCVTGRKMKIASERREGHFPCKLYFPRRQRRRRELEKHAAEERPLIRLRSPRRGKTHASRLNEKPVAHRPGDVAALRDLRVVGHKNHRLTVLLR